MWQRWSSSGIIIVWYSLTVNWTVCWMGRSKLKLSVRKNYERKRYLKNMTTEDEPEVAQDILLAVVMEVIPEVQRVSVPISLYREAQVHDISIPFSKLQLSGVWPAHWTCSMTSGSSIVLNKLRITSTHKSAEVLFFLLIIPISFACVLCIGQKEQYFISPTASITGSLQSWGHFVSLCSNWYLLLLLRYPQSSKMAGGTGSTSKHRTLPEAISYLT